MGYIDNTSQQTYLIVGSIPFVWLGQSDHGDIIGQDLLAVRVTLCPVVQVDPGASTSPLKEWNEYVLEHKTKTY